MPEFLILFTVIKLISADLVRLSVGFGTFDKSNLFSLILKFIYGHIWNVVASNRCAYTL